MHWGFRNADIKRRGTSDNGALNQQLSLRKPDAFAGTDNAGLPHGSAPRCRRQNINGQPRHCHRYIQRHLLQQMHEQATHGDAVLFVARPGAARQFGRDEGIANGFVNKRRHRLNRFLLSKIPMIFLGYFTSRAETPADCVPGEKTHAALPGSPPAPRSRDPAAQLPPPSNSNPPPPDYRATAPRSARR